jgi:hypothetical protein
MMIYRNEKLNLMMPVVGFRNLPAEIGREINSSRKKHLQNARISELE